MLLKGYDIMVKELSEYRKWAWNCFRDSMCKSVFPWHIKSSKYYQICPSGEKYKFDAYYAQGRLDIARAIIEDEPIISEKLKQIVFACQLCGACDYVCGRVKEMKPTEVIQALRIKLVKDGIGPMPAQMKFSESVKKTHNVYGESHEKRFMWMNQDVPTTKADILFFSGCTPSYRSQETALAMVKLLQKMGIDFMLLKDEWCCGSPLLRTGQTDLTAELIKHNVEEIEKSGATKVLTNCAGCYVTLKVDYPDFLGFQPNFEVVHIVEYLDQLRKEGKLTFTKNVDLKVTYHDPCHLGRNSYSGIVGTGQHGVYDPPRNLLKSIPGIKLIEMERIKDDAWCCGAGGGVKAAFKEFSLWTAKERIDEAKATGAEAIVSACPFCKTNFVEAIKAGEETMKVYDIIELLEKAI